MWSPAEYTSTISTRRSVDDRDLPSGEVIVSVTTGRSTISYRYIQVLYGALSIVFEYCYNIVI